MSLVDDFHERTAKPRQPKGSALLAARQRRHERVAAEQAIMREAVRLDGKKCRNPRCQTRSKRIPVDPCHLRHRGMGGNPTGDRTTIETVIALCRVCHGLYDSTVLDIEPLTPRGLRGACAWYLTDPETGERKHIATEKEQ